MAVTLNNRDDFNLDNYQRVARSGEIIVYGVQAIETMTASRSAFLEMLDSHPDLMIYGVTTGFGDKAKTLLTTEERKQLAQELAPIKSVGVGPSLEPEVIRGMIFARLCNFVSGHAAVSLETAHRVAAMLDGRELPKVPYNCQDSFGELAQLYNLFHTIHGENANLKDINILTNGSPCSAALAAEVALDAERRIRTATQVFALSTWAANMPLEPYDPAWKLLFDDPFEADAIDALNNFLDTSSSVRMYQAPISWRILARVLGTGYRGVHNMIEAARIGLRSITDNPSFMMPNEARPKGYTLQSGGFHNSLAYQTMGWLNSAWIDLSVIATRQIEQLNRQDVTGLPNYLTPPGTQDRTRYLETSALNACIESKDHATPATIPLGGGTGQTDIIMPIFRAYNKARLVGHNTDICLASLAVVASQAAWISNRTPPDQLRPLLELIQSFVPPIESTRHLGSEITRLIQALVVN